MMGIIRDLKVLLFDLRALENCEDMVFEESGAALEIYENTCGIIRIEKRVVRISMRRKFL